MKTENSRVRKWAEGTQNSGEGDQSGFRHQAGAEGRTGLEYGDGDGEE